MLPQVPLQNNEMKISAGRLLVKYKRFAGVFQLPSVLFLVPSEDNDLSVIRFSVELGSTSLNFTRYRETYFTLWKQQILYKAVALFKKLMIKTND